MLPIIASIVSGLISNGLPKVADAVVEKGVDYVQDKLGVELKPEGQATKEDYAKIQEEANRHAEFMAELDEKSTQRATDMQLMAMQSADPLVRRHVYYYAWFITIVSFVYFFAVSFMPVENKNRDFINIILGFLIGTAVNSLIRFFYGSSNKSQEDVDKKMKEQK
jgi:uncharacterized membrane-anchored protein YhcB (DUF1043 family)